uniref:Ras-related protein Rab-21 n=1 Tax=Trichuris muris TaxID=70415 RepID=A0A5S6Q921_TRIMR
MNRYKVVLLGEGSVGKTSILMRFIENTFEADRCSTLQAAFFCRSITCDGERIELAIWDTAGQERFHSLGPIYYRDSDGALLVYDVTDEFSFEKVKLWVKELRKMLGSSVQLTIVGNKTDLERARNVALADAEMFADEIGAIHCSTSAKTNEGIEKAFLSLCERMVAYRKTCVNDPMNPVNEEMDSVSLCSQERSRGRRNWARRRGLKKRGIAVTNPLFEYVFCQLRMNDQYAEWQTYLNDRGSSPSDLASQAANELSRFPFNGERELPLDACFVRWLVLGSQIGMILEVTPAVFPLNVARQAKWLKAVFLRICQVTLNMFLAASKHLRQLDNKDEKTAFGDSKQQARRASVSAHRKHSSIVPHTAAGETGSMPFCCLDDHGLTKGSDLPSEGHGEEGDSAARNVEGDPNLDQSARIKGGQVTWKIISKQITSNFNILLAEVEQLSSPNLFELLNSLNDWLEYASCFIRCQYLETKAPQREALDRLNEKVAFFKQYESAVKTLLEILDDKLLSGAADSQVRSVTQSFSTKWNRLLELTDAAVETLTTYLVNVPDMQLENAMQSLFDWLDCAEDVITTQDLDVVDQTEVTAAKIARLKELEKEMTIQRENLSFVVNAADELRREGANEHEALSGKLSIMVPRWSDIERVLTNQLARLESGFAILQDWELRVAELERWMVQVTEFIYAEKPAVGNVETLKAQLEQSQALISDVDALAPKVKEMETWADELKTTCTPRMAEYLRARMEETVSHWNEVVRVTRAKHESLNEAYSRSKKTFDDIGVLTKWLLGIEQEVHSFGSPGSGKELCAMIKRHKQILEELHGKSETIENAVYLGEQQFLNARQQWQAICQQMESRLSILTDAYELWKEFQELVAVERDSLDRLEGILGEPMKSAADAEEFSEQLDEFERQMEGGGGHNRIMEIAQALNSQMLLSNAVKNELNKYLARREEVLEPARERQKFLESDAREAQNIEQELHECLSWLSQVDFILKTRSECDVLASDVPEDYKRLLSSGQLLPKLYDDFDAHRNGIFRLERQIAHYQQVDQQLAAQRLAEQVNHLKKYMCDLQSKLERYKQPSELEDRLRRVRRILEDLEQSFELLTVTSDDLEEIDQLLEKVEVTEEAICELQCEVDDLKAARSEAQSSSTAGTLEIEELEEDLRNFHVKVMESRDKYQSIKDMLTISSTNLQTCSELLNEVESELRKSETEDSATTAEDRSRLVLAHRKQVADCSKYLRDTQVGLQKFSELTCPEAAAELQSILNLLRNKIFIISGKLDDWALINEKLTKEMVELQKKFFDIHADVACELNLTESDISQCGNDQSCLQVQLDHLKSLRPKVDSLKETAVELIAKGGDPLHSIELESGKLCRRWEGLLESTKDQLTQVMQTSESGQQKASSPNASFEKESTDRTADTEDWKSSSAVTELQVSTNDLATRTTTGDEDFNADGLVAQANALVDSVVSVEDLLIESEKDFMQLQSKFQDVSSTVEACSCHVHQLLDRSEKAKCAELRPNVVPILSKLESMDSKLKMLSKKVKALIEINDNHKRKHEMLNSRMKTCLASLVYLEEMDKENALACDAQVRNIEEELNTLFTNTQRDFAKLGVSFPDASNDPLSKLLNQAKSKLSAHISSLEVNSEAREKLKSFIADTVELDDECLALERKLSSSLKPSDSAGLVDHEIEYQSVSKGIDSLKKRVERLCDQQEAVLSQVRSDLDRNNVETVLNALNSRLDSLEGAYAKRFKKFEIVLERWQTLHQRLFALMAWLEQAEGKLSQAFSLKHSAVSKTASSTLEDIKGSSKEVDDMMEELQSMKTKHAEFLSDSDVAMLFDKLQDASKRLRELEAKLIADKNRLQRSDLEAKEELEELLFWLDETDSLLSTPCDPTDSQQLHELRNRTQARLDEVPEKVSQLEALMLTLRQLESNENVQEALKTSLKSQANELKNRLETVRTELMKRLMVCDQKIEACGRFWSDLRELSSWTQNVKNLLLECKTATIYTPSRLDLETLEREIKEKKNEIDAFANLYTVFCQEGNENDVFIGEATERGVQLLLNNWNAIQNMIELFHSSSSSGESAEDHSAGGDRIEADECSTKQMEMDQLIALPAGNISEVAHYAVPFSADRDSLAADSSLRDVTDDYSSLLSKPEDLAVKAAFPSVGRDLQELIRWDHWLADTTDECHTFCKLGDIEEIREAMKKEQAFSSQLKVNRAKIIRILECDQNTEVQHKAELLYKEWEKRIIQVELRLTELNNLLEHSRRWDDFREEIELFLLTSEKKISSAKVSEVPIEKLHKELASLEQLSLEADAYRRKMTDFNELSNFMVETYVHDDAASLSQMTSNLNTLWSKVNDNLRIRKAVLEALSRGRKDFFSAFQEFNQWLTRIEGHLESLDSDSNMTQLLKEVAYRRELRDKWKGVNNEIEVHENVFQSLCDTANALLVNTICSEEKEDFQSELLNLCQRWETATKLSDDVRARLDRAQERWERLTGQLQELIGWTEEANQDLLRQQPLGGDLERLKEQNDFMQSLSIDQARKDNAVKEVVQLARSYLLQQDLRPSIVGYGDEAGKDEAQQAKRESRRIGQMIKNDSDHLEELWTEFTENTNSWQKLVEETYSKMMLFYKAIDECKMVMDEADNLKATWQPVGGIKLEELTGSMEQARAFQQYLSCHVRLLLDDVNDHSSRLLADNVRLSSKMIRGLENLNLRYKELEGAITNRVALIQYALRNYGPSSQHFLQGSVSLPWERAVSTNRVPYYISHETEKTQWDHPKMVEIVNNLSEFNEIKFSAYRTAIKLRSLQKSLYLDLVQIDDLIDIFNQNKLQDVTDDQMDVSEIVMALLPIYELIQREHMTLLRSVPLAIDLCLNWLLNVYDPARCGTIRVLCFKVALILLCNAPIAEKYRYLFNQVSYNRRSLDQKKLALLLHECIQVPKFLGEVAAFGGTNIEPSVRSCFEKAKYPSEITLQQYFDWLDCEPQSIVWLAVMHRIVASENEKHQAKCNVCKMFPIVGLRYRCLKCFNFDMCQNCFFAQRVAKGHKTKHPMQEYCLSTKSGQDVRDFGVLIRNQFKSKQYWRKHPQLGYLPVQSVMEGLSLESREVAPVNPETRNLHAQIELYALHLSEIERSLVAQASDFEDDEHAVISSLSSTLTNDCPLNLQGGTVRSPAQLLSSTDCAQKNELTMMLKDLELENKRLLAEYEKLRVKVPNGMDKEGSGLQNSASTPMLPMTNGSLGRRGQHRSTCSLTRNHNHLPNTYQQQMLEENALHTPYTAAAIDDREFANETSKLRQQQERLEQRSRILEEHNQQLEVQLRRIRQLIEEQRITNLNQDDPAKPPQSFASYNASLHQDSAPLETVDEPPAALTDSYSNSSNRIGDLMNTVQDLGKAMGNLVNVVTSEDESSTGEMD